MYRSLALLTAALLFALNIGSLRSDDDEDKKAESSEDSSPAIALQPRANNHLGIPRGAFGQKFLMSMSVIPQSQAATSTGLAGKIVTFELFADAVDMYEDPDGLVVTGDLPTRRFVASFPIVDQNDELVTIDFNQGMRRTFVDIWYSINRFFNPSLGEQTYEIPGARVFEVSEKAGQLVIRQSALVRSRQFSSDQESRYEIRYFIKPYRPGDYQGKEFTRRDDPYVRYFEIAPRLEDTTGRPTTRIARFDLNKPLKFYYSSNTPEDYVDAVKGGIEYWNQAFGRKVIEAAEAPEGVTAPDATHNVIQWVPWDNAGFAYADIIVDPITGESQHGQAYMTSVFAISGKSRARQILRLMRARIKEEQKEEKKDEDKDGDDHDDDGNGDETKHRHSLFWPHSTVCQVSPLAFAKQYAEGLEKVLAHPEVTEKAVLQMSQDYVRGIVAHEVGHVLGLRHNFAGSLDTTVSHDRLQQWLETYLKGEDISEFKDDHTANSIMEYQEFTAEALTGAQMRLFDKVLPHDKGAIQWGYFDDRTYVEKKPLYAADGDRFWSDVRVFDYGKDPVISAYAEISDSISKIPSSLIERFIRAKAPRDPRDQIPLEQVNLSFLSDAFNVSFGMNDILQWFNSSTRSLTVERQFDFVGPLNRQEVYLAHWKRLNEQIEKLGGIDRALFAYLPATLKLELKEKPKGVAAAPKLNPADLNKRLKELLATPAYQKFIGLDDQEHEFTEEEIELITKRGEIYFEKLSEAIIQRACSAFGTARRDLGLIANERLIDGDIIAKMEKRIIEFANVVILAKDKDTVIEGKLNKLEIKVTDYKYTKQTRIAAARMLSNTVGSFKNWSRQGKSDINRKLKGEVEDALGINQIKSFKDTMLSLPLRKWYMDQQEILALLPAVRPSTPPKPSSGS